MPLIIPKTLPAFDALYEENVFVMHRERALAQHIRPLEILILNLMPTKIETETQLARLLANSPLQVQVTFLQTATHSTTHTAPEHMKAFYKTFDEIKNERFDGMIITGAPVENMEFEEVNYWDELTKIMEWSKTHVHSTLHICWGAQAGLYYHYGIPKYKREKKLAGIYRHKILNRKIPLVRSMDDYVMAPHSRYTEVRREDIEKHPELTIVAESPEAGIFLVLNDTGSQIFVQGHPEYDRVTLDGEYKRDLAKGLPIEIPKNYYKDDDPNNKPLLTWRAHANNLYTNWLNYYVYQSTPYDLYGTPDFREI